MSKFFINIYDWFDSHKKSFYLILTALVIVCVAMASQIDFQEHITNFFNDSKEDNNAVFENVQAKDKIVVMINGDDPDNIIAAAEIFETQLYSMIDDGLIKSVTAYADDEVIDQCTSFVYDYLPIFLNDEDYNSLEERLTKKGIDKTISNAYDMLTSPSGMVNLAVQSTTSSAIPKTRSFM